MVDNTTATNWVGELAPLAAADWTYQRARHLLDRAGFGGTPDDVGRLYDMGPYAAVSTLVDFDATATGDLPEFRQSPIYDPTLRDFPETRPAATRLAEKTGSAMGVSVKPARSIAPAAGGRSFLFLVARQLAGNIRLAHWWAECMLLSKQPLQEKMALFWHGHFATGADKVRDYRKMQVQLDAVALPRNRQFPDLGDWRRARSGDACVS